MSLISNLFDFILHIDVHMGEIINQYGSLTYVILFAIIFAETGFVITPFLPGDSLLFAVGAFASLGSLNIYYVLALLWIAAILGDMVNYSIGYYFGKKIISNKKFPIKEKHINQTKAYYDKHGGKTIFLARFIPIIRTYAPFVAGVSRMPYRHFMIYNFTGGFTWVFLFVLVGYFFGQIPWVKENFSIIVLGVIVISVLPIVIEMFWAWRKKEK